MAPKGSLVFAGRSLDLYLRKVVDKVSFTSSEGQEFVILTIIPLVHWVSSVLVTS